MTTDEIKMVFDAAGIPHILVHNANDSTKMFIALKINGNSKYCGYSYHDNEDEAYACMWKAFIGDMHVCGK